MIRRPPRSKRTDTLFPYTTLFRSIWRAGAAGSAPGLEGSPVRLAFLPVSDAGFGAQVFPFDGGAACGAGRARTGQSFAIAMDVFDRALGTGRLAPGLTPSTQREQHRTKGLAFRGRAILMAGRTPEIGRASCRERVCQYVSISGVAGSLKKKRNRSSTRNTIN